MSEAQPLLLAGFALSLTVTAAIGYSYGKRRSRAVITKQKRYLADMSHELRTPLTVIESYASMIKRWAGNDPKLREEAADVILSEASRLRRLTSQLLSPSLADAPLTVEPVATFDLSAQLTETAARLSVTFERNIRVQPVDVPLLVTGCSKQLQQLWVILLDNAIKYSNEAIDIKLEETSDIAVVTVRDQGVGIPPHEMPQLFNRLYRGESAQEDCTGSGIGLSIASEIVKRHGGDIRIESEPGQGTAVIVTLPKK